MTLYHYLIFPLMNFSCLRLIWIKAPEDDNWKNNLTTFLIRIYINVNIKMYIFDHLRMYIFAILPLDRYIFLSDKIFL